jgi:Utp11 protein
MVDVVRALPGENAESSSWDCAQIDFLECSFQIHSLFRHNFIFQLRVTVTLPPMTSSLRNSIHRRNHKERSQLAHRAKLGLLEKHADYVKRARDYHSKQDRLTRLKQKAVERNKDEFYFSMSKEKTRVFVFNISSLNKANLIYSSPRQVYISRAGAMLLFQQTSLKFSRLRMKIMFEP